MGPTIGRIVHYTNLGDKDGKYPPETQAAIITGINDDGTVALKVFYKTGIFDCPSVKFFDSPVRGCWTWPPRTYGSQNGPSAQGQLNAHRRSHRSKGNRRRRRGKNGAAGEKW
jgi:hypothetical protein